MKTAATFHLVKEQNKKPSAMMAFLLLKNIKLYFFI